MRPLIMRFVFVARRYVAALALLPGVFLLGCAGEEPPTKEIIRPVRAAKVGDPGQFKGRSFPGRAKATQEVELAFRVAGPLISRPVNIGDTVKKGDVVAQIDPRDFQVELRNVQGQLEEARAALQRAEADYKRSQNIFKEDPGAISETAVDRAREDRDRAQANVKSLEAAVDSAKDQLDYATLVAPFEGTVVATYVENYENVRAKQPIVRIVDDSHIEMVVNIPESLISVAPQVKDVRVEFDAFPDREVSAQIKEIGTEASETTRTYPVTLIMDQPEDIKILPGMAGKASGRPPSTTTAAMVEVPVAAVFTQEEPGKSQVWVIDEQSKKVSLREVKVGELTDRGIEIHEGLNPGEWVATAGVHYLQQGQQVRILEDRPESP